MDYNGLVAELRNLQVTPPDIMRASLYIKYLQIAKTYFNEDLKKSKSEGGLGEDYNFVGRALAKASLLNKLAEILDLYVGGVVSNELQILFKSQTYSGSATTIQFYNYYFNTNILAANDDTYNSNVDKFMSDYPATNHALGRLAANLQSNIKLCCERVILDRQILTDFFNANGIYQNTLSIIALTEIESSGSDFHKGGKQVLFLGFSGEYNRGSKVKSVRLKVVYKPSDLEADCLIAGNSNVVNTLLQRTFMEKSLFEIYNDALATDPNRKGLPLNTYRILPRNYNSQQGANNPLHVRDAYGYIEYLNHEVHWNSKGWFGYYPGGVSDFVIFKTQSSNIIQDFYRQAGAFCAVSCTFSIVDMHIQNVRVCRYNLYPIDLEVSLTKKVSEINTTSLMGINGGLTDHTLSVEGKWDFCITETATEKYYDLHRPTQTESQANRLCTAKSNRNPEVVDIDRLSLLQGFNDGMNVLQTAQAKRRFDVWFKRLNNVVVRYTPFGTDLFQVDLALVYLAPHPRETLLEDTLNTAILGSFTEQYKIYCQLKVSEEDVLPNFLALHTDVVKQDYLNLDVPAFYYCINENWLALVDSTGNPVSIPESVAIEGNPNAQCRSLVGRDTFFPNNPMNNNVQIPQVTALADLSKYHARFSQLQQSLLTALKLDTVPLVPQNAIPNL